VESGEKSQLPFLVAELVVSVVVGGWWQGPHPKTPPLDRKKERLKGVGGARYLTTKEEKRRTGGETDLPRNCL